HPLLLVTAGAERLVAGTGQRHHPDLAAGPRPLEREHQFVDGLRPEGVVPIGPVDGDPRQSVVDLVGDVGEFGHRTSVSFPVTSRRSLLLTVIGLTIFTTVALWPTQGQQPTGVLGPIFTFGLSI